MFMIAFVSAECLAREEKSKEEVRSGKKECLEWRKSLLGSAMRMTKVVLPMGGYGQSRQRIVTKNKPLR